MLTYLHDINNQLSVIGSFAELGLSAPREASELQRFFGAIRGAATMASELVERMRVLASPAPLDGCADSRACCDVNEWLAREAEALDAMHRWEIAPMLCSDLPPVRMPALDFKRVIANLVINACEAMDEAGSEPARITFGSATLDDKVFVHIADTGPGMSEKTRRRLLLKREGFSTKGDGHGSGVSRIVWPALLRCGGRMEIKTVLGEGSEFIVALPAAL